MLRTALYASLLLLSLSGHTSADEPAAFAPGDWQGSSHLGGDGVLRVGALQGADFKAELIHGDARGKANGTHRNGRVKLALHDGTRMVRYDGTVTEDKHGARHYRGEWTYVSEKKEYRGGKLVGKTIKGTFAFRLAPSTSRSVLPKDKTYVLTTSSDLGDGHHQVAMVGVMDGGQDHFVLASSPEGDPLVGHTIRIRGKRVGVQGPHAEGLTALASDQVALTPLQPLPGVPAGLKKGSSWTAQGRNVAAFAQSLCPPVHVQRRAIEGDKAFEFSEGVLKCTFEGFVERTRGRMGPQLMRVTFEGGMKLRVSRSQDPGSRVLRVRGEALLHSSGTLLAEATVRFLRGEDPNDVLLTCRRTLDSAANPDTGGGYPNDRLKEGAWFLRDMRNRTYEVIEVVDEQNALGLAGGNVGIRLRLQAEAGGTIGTIDGVPESSVGYAPGMRLFAVPSLGALNLSNEMLDRCHGVLYLRDADPSKPPRPVPVWLRALGSGVVRLQIDDPETWVYLRDASVPATRGSTHHDAYEYRRLQDAWRDARERGTKRDERIADRNSSDYMRFNMDVNKMRAGLSPADRKRDIVLTAIRAYDRRSRGWEKRMMPVYEELSDTHWRIHIWHRQDFYPDNPRRGRVWDIQKQNGAWKAIAKGPNESAKSQAELDSAPRQPKATSGGTVASIPKPPGKAEIIRMCKHYYDTKGTWKGMWTIVRTGRYRVEWFGPYDAHVNVGYTVAKINSRSTDRGNVPFELVHDGTKWDIVGMGRKGMGDFQGAGKLGVAQPKKASTTRDEAVRRREFEKKARYFWEIKGPFAGHREIVSVSDVSVDWHSDREATATLAFGWKFKGGNTIQHDSRGFEMWHDGRMWHVKRLAKSYSPRRRGRR